MGESDCSFSDTYSENGNLLNRLASAVESGGTSEWSQYFGYDSYGNGWVSSSTGVPFNSFTPTVSTNFDSKNRLQIQNAQYDNNGNQTVIGGFSFSYDAENRQRSNTINTATTTYTYDGDGRRAMKTSGGVTTVYVYDAMGELALEDSSSESAAQCTTCYLVTDALGSTRMVTNGSGVVVAMHDYYPFGVEIPSGVGGRSSLYGGTDGVTQKFTGKERDSETGLDFFGARYYSGAQERFTSVDPISGTLLHIINPQRWNMYAYVLNNPLAYVDPDGRDVFAVKYANGAPFLGGHFGHAAFGVVHRDGKVRFADFAPQHHGSFYDKGQYGYDEPATHVDFDSTGTPTKDALVKLANELADFEGAPHDSVSISYYKTSDADTAAGDAYIDNARRLQEKGKQPNYFALGQNCAAFCMNGLTAAGLYDHSSGILMAPNWIWDWVENSANLTVTGTTKAKPNSRELKPDVHSTFRPLELSPE